jgi:hypothetical protein
MGELIIHIDQATGSVLKVQQKLDDKQKEMLANSPDEFVEQQKETNLITEEQEQEIQSCIQEQIEGGVVTLPPLGNIDHGDDEEVGKLLKHRDRFEKIENFPLELWKLRGRTICSINVGGIIRKCYH